MRWQRIARLAIAVVVLVFAAVVAVKLLRPTKPRVPAQATPRVDQKSVAELGPLTHTQHGRQREDSATPSTRSAH